MSHAPDLLALTAGVKPNHFAGAAITAVPAARRPHITERGLGDVSPARTDELLRALEAATDLAHLDLGLGPVENTANSLTRALGSVPATITAAELSRSELRIGLDAAGTTVRLRIPADRATAQAQALMDLLDVWGLEDTAGRTVELLYTHVIDNTNQAAEAAAEAVHLDSLQAAASATALRPVALRELDEDPTALIW